MPRVSVEHEQAVRERIVLASARVFAERGFHRSTIQDVVRESGLSVGAIYTYFKGKDDLFLACCDLSVSQSLGELARRIYLAASTAEKLAIAVGFYLDTVDAVGAQPGQSPFLIQAWAEADQEPPVRDMLARRRQQISTVGEMLLSEGIARGDLPAWVDTAVLASAYTVLLDGLLLQRIEAGAAWRRSDAERRAREVLVLLLAAAASPARPSLPVVEPRPFAPGGLE